MVSSQMQMIADVLNWPISAEKKIEYLKMLLKEGAPAPAAAPKRPAPAKAARPKRKAKAKGKRPLTARVRLWQELKRVAPEKAGQLDYTTITAEKIQAVLNEIKT